MKSKSQARKHMNGIVQCVAMCMCAAVVTGCSGVANGTVSMETAVNPAGWKTGETVKVLYDNCDTVSLRVLSLFVVGNGLGQCVGTDIEVAVVSPDSLRFADTVRLMPADVSDDGRVWNRIFRADAVLNRTGQYLFEMTPCENAELYGMRAVGIEITNTDNGERQIPQVSGKPDIPQYGAARIR